jgi:hypothetical protein
MLPAADRLPDADRLFERGSYFVIHAPRQTGKTTTLLALTRQLTEQGRYAALYISCKPAEAAAGEVRSSQLSILQQIRSSANQHLAEALRPPAPWPEVPDLNLLGEGLRAWAHASPRPLVLFFDEIDTLYGIALRSVLAQLHAGFPNRPGYAPWSVVLCGLRDIRDYREAAGKDPERFGSASPFNIKVKSVRLGDFTEAEIATLYEQHHADTGQSFSQEAVSRVFALTCGQPWLVNALAREIIDEMNVRDNTLTAEHVDQARDRLILARQTHLDSLVARLREDRVRRVLEPVIAGSPRISSQYDDDVEYVQDLGLFALGRPVRVANPIYREVIVRVLGHSVQRELELDPRDYVGSDGRIDMGRLLQRFAVFFRENGEVLEGDQSYHEVAPQLVMMAFLQGVVNGQGQLAREYGIGRDRIDLLMEWPYLGEDGKRRWQKEALELKVWRDKRTDPLESGLEQLDGYLDRLGLLTGYLVIFDRRSGSGPLAERVRTEPAQTPKSRPVTVLRA